MLYDVLLFLAKYIFFSIVHTSGYRKWLHQYKLWRIWEYFWNHRGQVGALLFFKNFERVATHFIKFSTYFLCHEFIRTFKYNIRLLVYTYVYTFIHMYVHIYIFICMSIHTFIHTFIRKFIHTYFHTYVYTFYACIRFMSTYVYTYVYIRCTTLLPPFSYRWL